LTVALGMDVFADPRRCETQQLGAGGAAFARARLSACGRAQPPARAHAPPVLFPSLRDPA
jgi:hypothetical protein